LAALGPNPVVERLTQQTPPVHLPAWNSNDRQQRLQSNLHQSQEPWLFYFCFGSSLSPTFASEIVSQRQEKLPWHPDFSGSIRDSSFPKRSERHHSSPTTLWNSRQRDLCECGRYTFHSIVTIFSNGGTLYLKGAPHHFHFHNQHLIQVSLEHHHFTPHLAFKDNQKESQ
jgi:hypothetical protein